MFQGKILVGNTLIVNVNGKSHTVTIEHPNYANLLECFKNDDAEGFIANLQVEKQLEKYVDDPHGKVTVRDGEVYYNGELLDNAITDTIKTMMRFNIDFEYMLKFLERVMTSCSYRVKTELFNFLQACGLTITDDGCFLAYKTVKSDYMDKYTGTIDNSIGSSIPRMDRSDVDDDCSNACSHGYHVGALAYAGPGGWYNKTNDKVMICKVAPEDVVSVPKDASFQKLRCCYYEVVDEYKAELEKKVYSGEQNMVYETSYDNLVDNYLEAEEMVVGEVYTFRYRSEYKEEDAIRHCCIEDDLGDAFLGILEYPEDYEGDYRRFKKQGIHEVTLYDPMRK
jgi:hypothetical protein